MDSFCEVVYLARIPTLFLSHGLKSLWLFSLLDTEDDLGNKKVIKLLVSHFAGLKSSPSDLILW